MGDPFVKAATATDGRMCLFICLCGLLSFEKGLCLM